MSPTVTVLASKDASSPQGFNEFMSLPSEGPSPLMNPRDIALASKLSSLGLTMVEIKISQFSIARGQWVGGIDLPDHSRLMFVVRDGVPMTNLEATFINEGDALWILTSQEESIRDFFFV